MKTFILFIACFLGGSYMAYGQQSSWSVVLDSAAANSKTIHLKNAESGIEYSFSCYDEPVIIPGNFGIIYNAYPSYQRTVVSLMKSDTQQVYELVFEDQLEFATSVFTTLGPDTLVYVDGKEVLQNPAFFRVGSAGLLWGENTGEVLLNTGGQIVDIGYSDPSVNYATRLTIGLKEPQNAHFYLLDSSHQKGLYSLWFNQFIESDIQLVNSSEYGDIVFTKDSVKVYNTQWNLEYAQAVLMDVDYDQLSPQFYPLYDNWSYVKIKSGLLINNEEELSYSVDALFVIDGKVFIQNTDGAFLLDPNSGLERIGNRIDFLGRDLVYDVNLYRNDTYILVNIDEKGDCVYHVQTGDLMAEKVVESKQFFSQYGEFIALSKKDSSFIYNQKFDLIFSTDHPFDDVEIEEGANNNGLFTAFKIGETWKVYEDDIFKGEINAVKLSGFSPYFMTIEDENENILGLYNKVWFKEVLPTSKYSFIEDGSMYRIDLIEYDGKLMYVRDDKNVLLYNFETDRIETISAEYLFKEMEGEYDLRLLSNGSEYAFATSEGTLDYGYDLLNPAEPYETEYSSYLVFKKGDRVKLVFYYDLFMVDLSEKEYNKLRSGKLSYMEDAEMYIATNYNGQIVLFGYNKFLFPKYVDELIELGIEERVLTLKTTDRGAFIGYAYYDILEAMKDSVSPYVDFSVDPALNIDYSLCLGHKKDGLNILLDGYNGFEPVTEAFDKYSFVKGDDYALKLEKDKKYGIYFLEDQVSIPIAYSKIELDDANGLYYAEKEDGLMDIYYPMEGSPFVTGVSDITIQDGFVYVKANGKIKVFTNDFSFLVELPYDQVQFYLGDYFIARADDKFGVVGYNNEIFTPIEYDEYKVEGEILYLEKDGMWYVFDIGSSELNTTGYSSLKEALK